MSQSFNYDDNAVNNNFMNDEINRCHLYYLNN